MPSSTSASPATRASSPGEIGRGEVRNVSEVRIVQPLTERTELTEIAASIANTDDPVALDIETYGENALNILSHTEVLRSPVEESVFLNPGLLAALPALVGQLLVAESSGIRPSEILPVWPGAAPGDSGTIGPERVRAPAEAPSFFLNVEPGPSPGPLVTVAPR